ncbi:MAG TPA: autotransporter domain-containing protein, partial [Rhodanobacter sp.]|nr:autotransporter domain-containing protein [Rhodanobacter sp.]
SGSGRAGGLDNYGGNGGHGGSGGTGVSGASFTLNNYANSTIAGSNGGNGGRGGAGYGIGGAPVLGGSGGNGGHGVSGTGFTLTSAGTITGGKGGNGGAGMYGGTGGVGGNGGTGGAGVSGTDVALTNTAGTIAGGKGGNGAYGGYGTDGLGGLGGTGGAGANVSGGGLTLTNNAAIKGGAGGAGGDSGAGASGGNSSAGAGGAGGTGVSGTDVILINTGTITGGNGSGGGLGYSGRDACCNYSAYWAGGTGAAGGAGGAGGAGVNGSGFTLSNTGTITGGAGSTGGNGGNGGVGGLGGPGGTGGAGGTGGTGGAGVSGLGFTLANTGTINGSNGSTGGMGGVANGGFGGTLGSSGDNGTGGVGVVSTGGSTITNSGAINGGMGGDGSTQASAVELSGGGNMLTLESGYSFTGNVVSSSGNIGGDTLALGGDVDAIGGNTFDVSTLVATLPGSHAGTQYAGFAKFSKTGLSSWTLTGTGSADQHWLISGGTLIGDTTSLQGTQITDNATLAFNQSVDGTYAGVISGSGALLKQGTGTLVLTGASTYTGGTTIGAGTLQLGNGGSTGMIVGNVANGGQLVFDHSDNLSFAGAISGSGSLSQNGSGVLTLTGTNSYTGGTIVNAGTLHGDAGSLHGNIISNAALVFDQNTDSLFAGTLAGTGSLTKTGSGTLTFNGSNPFSGATTVSDGKLVVGDDSHAGATLGGTVTIASGALLGGIGTVGGLDLAGTVTPGNSIGTLAVSGNAVFRSGSSYQLEASPDGSTDRIAVTGTAKILGGNVQLQALAGTWAPLTSSTILTAGGGVSGTFASATSNLAFLDPVLSYSANAVNLSLQRNDVGFADVGQTRNQRAVAAAAESLGANSPVYAALVKLDAAGAQHAYEQLAGEIHASTRTAIIEGERHVRDAVNHHLLGLGNQSNGLSATADSGVTAWSAVWGHDDDHSGDGHAAAVKAHGSGVLVGADRPVGAASRLGVLIASGETSTRIGTLGASSHAQKQNLGIYGSTQTGPLQWQGAAIYGWQSIGTHRALAFGDFDGSANSRYHATTAQAYVDGSYAMTFDRGTLTPFVRLAHERLSTAAIHETGTAAALDVSAKDTAQTRATLGWRGSLALDTAGSIRGHASVGWQHAWGDTVPNDSQRFAGGGDTFDVTGVAVARNAAAVTAGISFALAPTISFDASYSGQFASHTTDQAARMSFVWVF